MYLKGIKPYLDDYRLFYDCQRPPLLRPRHLNCERLLYPPPLWSASGKFHSQRPKLVINHTTGGTSSNQALSITSFSPSNLTPLIAQNTTTPFSVTTNQQVTSTWYLNGVNQNNDAQAWSKSWNIPGQYNVTNVGSNANSSVSMTWNINVQNGSYSLYDVNQDGFVNQTDLDIVWNSIITNKRIYDEYLHVWIVDSTYFLEFIHKVFISMRSTSS